MTQLDFADLTEPLGIAWLAALTFGVFLMVISWKQGQRTSRHFLGGVLEIVSFGSLMTIFGIARQANSLGLISFRLFLFIFCAAVMAAGCGRWAGRLQSRPEA